MTRAVKLALHGEIGASLHMHALAVPILLSTLAVVSMSVLETLRKGTPEGLWYARPGRALVVAFLATQAGAVVLWALRLAGLFGGPVPV
jgi:hypothetical protein